MTGAENFIRGDFAASAELKSVVFNSYLIWDIFNVGVRASYDFTAGENGYEVSEGFLALWDGRSFKKI